MAGLPATNIFHLYRIMPFAPGPNQPSPTSATGNGRNTNSRSWGSPNVVTSALSADHRLEFTCNVPVHLMWPCREDITPFSQNWINCTARTAQGIPPRRLCEEGGVGATLQLQRRDYC